MEIPIFLVVCLMVGYCLFNMLLGGQGADAVQAKPGMAFAAIVVLAVVAALGFLVLGVLIGE